VQAGLLGVFIARNVETTKKRKSGAKAEWSFRTRTQQQWVRTLGLVALDSAAMLWQGVMLSLKREARKWESNGVRRWGDKEAWNRAKIPYPGNFVTMCKQRG
jgi:hypothetical protein